MQVSTRGRYALRAVLDLALQAKAGPVARQDIAARQEISAEYVAQLFRQLGAAGIVQGVKGPGGGYRLARDAGQISVGDVLRAVEGPIAAAPCLMPGRQSRCGRVDACTAHLLWKQLSEAIARWLDAITLLDLCDQAQHITRPDVPGSQSLMAALDGLPAAGGPSGCA